MRAPLLFRPRQGGVVAFWRHLPSPPSQTRHCGGGRCGGDLFEKALPHTPSQKRFVKKMKKARGNSLRQKRKERTAEQIPSDDFCRNSIPFFTLHSSLFTYILPPSGREGDREAGEGARGRKSKAACLIAGGYGIRPYDMGVISTSAKEPKASYISLIVGRGLAPAVCNMLYEHFNSNQQNRSKNEACFSIFAAGASPRPTVLPKYRLIPSQNNSLTSPSGEISHRRYFICRQRQISLAEGEFHCATRRRARLHHRRGRSVEPPHPIGEIQRIAQPKEIGHKHQSCRLFATPKQPRRPRGGQKQQYQPQKRQPKGLQPEEKQGPEEVEDRLCGRRRQPLYPCGAVLCPPHKP